MVERERSSGRGLPALPSIISKLPVVAPASDSSSAFPAPANMGDRASLPGAQMETTQDVRSDDKDLSQDRRSQATAADPTPSAGQQNDQAPPSAKNMQSPKTSRNLPWNMPTKPTKATRKPRKRDPETAPMPPQIFAGMRILWLPLRHTADPKYWKSARADAEERGASSTESMDDGVTHIIINQISHKGSAQMDLLQWYLKKMHRVTLPPGVPVLTVEWLAACKIRQKLVEFFDKSLSDSEQRIAYSVLRYRVYGMRTAYDIDTKFLEGQESREVTATGVEIRGRTAQIPCEWTKRTDESVDDFLERLQPSKLIEDEPTQKLTVLNPAAKAPASVHEKGEDLHMRVQEKSRGTYRKESMSGPQLRNVILSVAQDLGVMEGKWMLWVHEDRLDQAWKAVVEDTLNDKLGYEARMLVVCSPNREDRHGIFIYTPDLEDMDEVQRVVNRLWQLSHIWAREEEQPTIYFKPKIMSLLEMRNGNEWGMAVGRYTSKRNDRKIRKH